jgi:hypothetical protein
MAKRMFQRTEEERQIRLKKNREINIKERKKETEEKKRKENIALAGRLKKVN